MSTIKVLIADDHEVVRSGLKSLLAGTEIKVVAEVGTAPRPRSSTPWKATRTWSCWTSACRTATA